MFVFMQSPASKNSEIIQKDIDFWAQFQPRISSFTCIRAFHMHSRWTMCDSALTCRLVYLNDCDHFSFYHRSISFMTDCTPCSVRQHHVPYSQKDHRPPSVTPSSWIKKKNEKSRTLFTCLLLRTATIARSSYSYDSDRGWWGSIVLLAAELKDRL